MNVVRAQDGMGMEKQSSGSTVVDWRPQLHDSEDRTCDWNKS